MFYCIAYVTELLCAGKNINKELRDEKSNQNMQG